MITSRQLLIVPASVAVLCATGLAFVHPPRDLLNGADTVFEIEIQSLDANTGIAVAKVVEVLKADPNTTEANKPVKEIKINFLAMGPQLGEQGKRAMGWVESGYTQAVFFAGKLDLGLRDEGALEDKDRPRRGLLNIAGNWLVLNQDPNSSVWEMEKIWEFLLGYWAGSTDMFVKCIKRTVADPGFDAPVEEGVEWDANAIARVGKVGGEVSAAIPVDITGKGQADLFVASDSGDRVFRWDGNALVDVTAKLELTSKSLVAAWGDFNGDGKLALASRDGKSLSIFSQMADGTFAAKVCQLGDALKDGCISLSALDAFVKGKAGLLVGTKSWPVLLVPQGGGAFVPEALGKGPQGEKLRTPGACMVADLDGDDLIDVLQVFPDASLFYKGSAPGAFAAPVRSAVAAGPGRWGACLADFDGDGLQDLFIAGEEQNGMWQNLGGGKFTDMLGFCGSLGYISKSGGIAASGGDFNNDGRQDLMIGYGTSRMAPQLFFNRGFRCFGLTRAGLDIAEHKATLEQSDRNLVADCSKPQQAGCLGDFNGDGALDMALVLGNGDVVFFPRKVDSEKRNNKCVVASVPLSAGRPGPVNVRAYDEKWLLGAWVVRAGEPGAIIGARSPGAITLKWTWPDGKEQKKRVVVRDGPVRVLLDGN